MSNKRNPRRTLSLHREVYVAASKLAFRRDVTLCQLVTDALRAYGVEAPETIHVPREIAEHNAEAIRHGIVRREEKLSERKCRARGAIGTVIEPRLVQSIVFRPGPIRQALGDVHADAYSEPLRSEPIPSPVLIQKIRAEAKRAVGYGPAIDAFRGAADPQYQAHRRKVGAEFHKRLREAGIHVEGVK